ncbi:MAG: protein translocase subunit SecD [Patescibacteria group bacterium]
MSSSLKRYGFILLLVVVSLLIALPQKFTIPYHLFGNEGLVQFVRPDLNLNIGGVKLQKSFDLKSGLDIQGGTQIILEADMSSIPEEDRVDALESTRQVILRRVDLYGVNEPVVQSSITQDDYRIIVELAGVDDPEEALQLIGTTAQLDFRLQGEPTPESTVSARAFLSTFKETPLNGKDLKRSSVQFDQQSNAPVVTLEFNDEGAEKFAEITKANVNNVLGIFLDNVPLMLPRINVPILDGRAIITGGFTVDEAKNLSIQLNAGALPVSVHVLQQQTIGASLGQSSVQKSVVAGLLGLGLVMLFMVLLYGWKGFIADIALIIYAILTIALYKLMNVTLTLPGIAGLVLSIGMAVDANILIFERMKEELRAGKPFELAMKLGFGRAWDSIKDANITTIFTSLVLINPFNFPFLNSSGLVRGFGLTLFIGVVLSLFTGVVVSRTLMRIFLKPYEIPTGR